MNFEVRITQAAWADVERIYEWIRDEKRAPLNAQRWFNGWLRRVRNLETFPEGRSHAPETGTIPGMEMFHQMFGAFRSLYVVRDQVVFIVHVRRGSRQPATPDELLLGMEEAGEG